MNDIINFLNLSQSDKINITIPTEHNVPERNVPERNVPEHNVLESNVLERNVPEREYNEQIDPNIVSLNNWKKIAEKYSNIHSTYEKKYKSKDRIVSSLNIFVTCCLNISIILKINIDLYQIIFGLLSLSDLFLTTIQKHLNYQSCATRHKHLSVRYRALYHDIEYKINHDNGKLDRYVIYVKNKLDKLSENTPSGIH